MESYRELRDRQQKEFNELPLGFAFSDKQFDEMMEKWGLDPEKEGNVAENDLIRRRDVLKLIEDIKCDDGIPKNYGTLLDIMRKIRALPAADILEKKQDYSVKVRKGKGIKDGTEND